MRRLGIPKFLTVEHWLYDADQPGIYNGAGLFIVNPPYAFTQALPPLLEALRDALAAVDIPFVEVHLSNVHRREPFRHHSYFSDLAVGVIAGLGADGYRLALDFALSRRPAGRA